MKVNDLQVGDMVTIITDKVNGKEYCYTSLDIDNQVQFVKVESTDIMLILAEKIHKDGLSKYFSCLWRGRKVKFVRDYLRKVYT